MTDAAHTPAPWKIAQNSNLIVTADEKFSVAVIQPLIGCNGGKDGVATAEANARLITAAPDMAAALLATQQFPWVHNAAITNDMEALRAICLAYSEWNNAILCPLLDKIGGAA